MAKIKPQKTEKILNKEFEQAISALNPGENLAIERPPEKRGAWLWAASSSVVAVIAVGVWFFALRPAPSLADRLPNETSFYFSLVLPRAARWSDRIFFWRGSAAPSRDISRLFQKLEFVGWPGVDWQKQILPLLKNKVELARLDNGTLILKTELTDKEEWLSLVKADESANNNENPYAKETRIYQGEIIQPEEETSQPDSSDARIKFWSGLWPGLTKNPNKIQWRVWDRDLYLSDDPNFESYFAPRRSLPKFEPGLVQVFIKDKEALEGLDGSFGQFFAPGLVFPFKMVVRDNGQNLVWLAGAIDEKFAWGFQDNTNNPDTQPGDVLTVWASNPGALYRDWRAGLAELGPNRLTKNINELEQFAKEFYNLDLAAGLEAIGNRELNLRLGINPKDGESLFGNNWSLRIKSQESEPILELLRQFAVSLFAAAHPQAVEHRLSDGTAMVELRATRDGLAWQPLQWTSQGERYSFYSLRGQGEEAGYFTGFVPGKGYFLTNSLSLIGENTAGQEPVDDQISCEPPFKPVLAVALPGSLMANDIFWGEVIGNASLTASAAGLIGGCLRYSR